MWPENSKKIISLHLKKAEYATERSAGGVAEGELHNTVQKPNTYLL